MRTSPGPGDGTGKDSTVMVRLPWYTAAGIDSDSGAAAEVVTAAGPYHDTGVSHLGDAGSSEANATHVTTPAVRSRATKSSAPASIRSRRMATPPSTSAPRSDTSAVILSRVRPGSTA